MRSWKVVLKLCRSFFCLCIHPNIGVSVSFDIGHIHPTKTSTNRFKKWYVSINWFQLHTGWWFRTPAITTWDGAKTFRFLKVVYLSTGPSTEVFSQSDFWFSASFLRICASHAPRSWGLILTGEPTGHRTPPDSVWVDGKKSQLWGPMTFGDHQLPWDMSHIYLGPKPLWKTHVCFFVDPVGVGSWWMKICRICW